MGQQIPTSQRILRKKHNNSPLCYTQIRGQYKTIEGKTIIGHRPWQDQNLETVEILVPEVPT